jgi:hypothetical protein
VVAGDVAGVDAAAPAATRKPQGGKRMDQVFPISKDLVIPSRFVERKWMRSQKAWRCLVEIPTENELPSQLTGLIDSQIEIEIQGEINITIAPAFVVDVPHKGKKFFLSFETCFEHQASIGPMITALPDTNIIMTLRPYNADPAPEKKPNDCPLTPQEIKGLHVGFFRNERFWEFLSSYLPPSQSIGCETTCKEKFKQHINVASCKDINREEFTALVDRFNQWLKR